MRPWSAACGPHSALAEVCRPHHQKSAKPGLADAVPAANDSLHELSELVEYVDLLPRQRKSDVTGLGRNCTLLDLSVKRQIIAVFTPIVLIIALLGVGSVVAIQGAIGSLHHVYTQNVTGIAALSTTDVALNKLGQTVDEGLQSSDLGDRAAMVNKLPRLRRGVEDAWQGYFPQRITSAKEKAQAETAYSRYQSLASVLAKIRRMASNDVLSQGARDRLRQTFDQKVDAFSKQLGTLQQVQRRAAQSYYADASASAWTWSFVLLGLSIFAVVLAIVLMVRTIGRFTRPLLSARRVTESIANGQLDNDIKVLSQDEFGELFKSLTTMQQYLADMVRQVRQSAQSVNVGASEIASGNDDLNNRTQQQAASLE